MFLRCGVAMVTYSGEESGVRLDMSSCVGTVETDRQADRQTGRQKDRQTERETGRETVRETDRQIGRQIDRQEYRLIEIADKTQARRTARVGRKRCTRQQHSISRRQTTQ